MKTHQFLSVVLVLLAAVLLSACVQVQQPPVAATATATPTKAATAAPATAYPTSTSTPAATEKPTVPPAPTATTNAAVAPFAETLRLALAAELQIADANRVKLAASEAVRWPDGCLGVPHEGTVCTDAIVPGYRLTYQVNGQAYELHTNDDGGTVLLAQGPQVKIGERVLIWQGTLGGACARLEVDAAGNTAWSRCPGALFGTPLVNARRAGELGILAAQYQSVFVNNPGDSLQFKGTGSAAPGAAQTRALNEWARAVWQEQHAGLAAAQRPFGIALTWSRQGGSSGACDTLELSRSGIYYAQNCKSMQPGIVPHLLPAGELDQLYAWLKRFGSVSLSSKDANGATLSLTLAGDGSDQPSAADQQLILQWAEKVFLTK